MKKPYISLIRIWQSFCPMRIRIDESGDFDFRNPRRLAVGTVASVVIPDGRWPAVEAFVNDRKRAWEMPLELKAQEMNHDQLLEMAGFLENEGLKAVGAVTDSRIFDIEAQRRWRRGQVENFEEAAERSHRAVTDSLTRERVERLRVRLPSERHVKPPNFLQYFILMPWLLSWSMSTALYYFRGLDPGSDGWTFDIAVDPREGADPGKAGVMLRDSVDAIFASDEGTALYISPDWPEDHPFFVRNADHEVGSVSPRQLLADGIKTPNSDEDAGLQLADFVAHAIYSVVRGDDESATEIWHRLRPLMSPTDDGRPLMIWGAPDEEASAEDEERYERLLDP